MVKTLFYGDNLPVLRNYIPSESVDLVYLDPPFNSKANYNILFEDKSGKNSQAQVEAFEDTWHWNEETEKTYLEIINTAPAEVVDMISAYRKFIKQSDMFAYIVMMTIRLVELKRVLKPTGSIYLHCDPTASHYLKVVMDTIFGVSNFRNEIIWKRTSAHNSSKRWGPIHDTILFYSKSEDYYWNKTFQEYEKSYLEDFYKFEDEKGKYQLVDLTGAGKRTGDSGKAWKNVNPTEKGRHWAIPSKTLEKIIAPEESEKLNTQEKLDLLEANGYINWPAKGKIPRYKRYSDENPGTLIQDIITDINPLSSQAKERLGYPTQKPRTLLERIIKSSAKEDAVILDPFCGCGTTISACENLNKNEGYKLNWQGIDITHLAINLIKGRLLNEYNIQPKSNYATIGEPEDLSGAQALCEQDRYQFQWWALSLINARPYGDKKKGADTGIDGFIFFVDYLNNKTEKAIVQVKSGKVKSGDIRDLKGVVEREEAAFGIFLTLQDASRDMKEEAVKSGFWKDLEEYPKIQIITIDEILNGKKAKIPYQVFHSKEAERVGKKDTTGKLFQ